MGDLSKHFSRHEFACKCGCGFDAINTSLVILLETVREKLGAPVTIASGCRCEKRNRQVGGARFSQHTLGTAADIQVKGVEPDVVAAFLETMLPSSHGIGRYKTFTHIDVRGKKSRWDGR